MAAKAATAMAATTAAVEKVKSASAIDTLNSISLESIDAEMADIEGRKLELQKQIDALKACRKIIDIRINGKSGRSEEVRQRMAAARAAKKAAKSQSPSAAAPLENAGTSMAELAAVDKIARYLSRVDSAKPYHISQNVGVASPEVLRLMKKYNDRFAIDPVDDRWSLRPAM